MARDDIEARRGYRLRAPWTSRPSDCSPSSTGALIAAFAIWRRGALRNGDVLLLLGAGLVLLLVGLTDVLDTVLGAFSFRRGNGGRILGLAVGAVIVLFVLTMRSLITNARIERKLSATLEGIAWEEFRAAGLAGALRRQVAVVIPAYNEVDNIAHVLPRIPASVCGVETPSSWSTTARATEPAASPCERRPRRTHVTLGGGAALRTGYR